MSRPGVVAACALFLVAGPGWMSQANAVDFRVMEYRGQRVLLIQDERKSDRHPNGGSILYNDAKRFEAALKEGGPITEVLFDSRGGSERDGLAIGRAIRRYGLATRIPSGAICASACADAFLGGVARRVEDGGRYGIHMPTIAASPETVQKILGMIEKERAAGLDGVQRLIYEIEKLSAQSASRWAAYVLQMGASIRIVDAGTRYLASQMNWLNRKELMDLNVVNVDD
ncbi:MAG: hypothetical protein ACREI6_10380 [Candidatus Rokuibacteriota bacterium]